VESPDYRKYLANLRAIGCPEETIRDIISADLKQLYTSRKWNVVSPATRVVRYWETNFSFNIGENEFNQLRQLENEYRSASYELLGTEPPKSESSFSEMNMTEMEVLRGFGALADSKFDQLIDWQLRKYDLGRTIDPTSASYVDDVLKVQAESEKELANILTPEELEQHQLRTSPLASELREQLSNFHPSEEEFVELFRLRTQFQDPFAKAQPLSVQTQQELQSRLRALLGPTRYADYERSVGARLTAK